jgi:hypothetical protein
MLVGDGFYGDEFLECAIKDFWEAIAQWLQFFTPGDREFQDNLH